MNQKIKELSKNINELKISNNEKINSLKEKQKTLAKKREEISKLIKSIEEPPEISIIQLEKGITQNFVDNLIEVQSNDIVSRIIKKNTKKKIYNNIIIPNIINSIVNLQTDTSFAIRKKDEINKKLLPIYTQISNIVNSIVNLQTDTSFAIRKKDEINKKKLLPIYTQISNIVNSIVNLEKDTSFAIHKKHEINKKKLLPIYTEISNIINNIVNLEKDTSFAIRKKDEINKKKLLPIYTEIPNILNNIVNTVSSDIVVYNKAKSNITEITKHSINYYDIMKEPNILNGLIELLNDRDYIKINKMNKKDKIEKILLTQKYLPDIINNISTLLINSLFYIKKVPKIKSDKKSIFSYIKEKFRGFSTPSLSSLSKMFSTASVSDLMDILKASSYGLSSAKFKNMLKSKGFNFSQLKNIKKENKNSQFIFDFTKYFKYEKKNSENNSLNNFRNFISELKKDQTFIKILNIFKDSILIYKYIHNKSIFLYINYYGEEIFLSYNNKTSEYNGNTKKIKPEIESIFKKLTYLN
jgi:ribosomal protein S15P/S13E